MQLFNRKVKLKIQVGNQLKTYDADGDNPSLKIDFSVMQTIGGIPPNGEITITGLDKRDIALLSTNYNPYNGTLRPSYISLSAGYSENISKILGGNITIARPDFTSPDMSIKLQVQQGILNSLENSIADNLTNTKASLVCAKIAQNNKLTLDFEGSDFSITKYTYAGTPLNQIAQFKKTYPNKHIFIKNDRLVVRDLEFKDNEIVLISGDTGLIGTPSPTPLGCEFSILLNPKINVGDSIKLVSAHIPQINGFYNIITAKHEGSNRGEAWRTDITGRALRG